MKKTYSYLTSTIIGLLILFVLAGCTSLKNLPGYIAGTYVSQPEEGTEGRYTETFNSSYANCYQDTKTALSQMGASIRHESKKDHVILAWFFNKIYDNCIDTTKVSIYFEEVNPEKTKVGVACGNYGLAKFASEELFKRLKS